MEFKDKVKKILEIFEIQEVEELPCKLYEIVENHETKTYNKYRKITGNNTNFIQHNTIPLSSPELRILFIS